MGKEHLAVAVEQVQQVDMVDLGELKEAVLETP
jgi:hypothetical protein